jgi:hypothetical protein
MKRFAQGTDRTQSILLQAKDGNRPHLMSHAFTDDALLRMVVNTGTISFPPVSDGRDAIAELLVRRFGRTYENVYTLCLSPPPEDKQSTFSCDWMVVMTEKESRAVRVGCGSYDWHFASDSFLADRLSITVEAMQSLPSQDVEEVMNWVSALSLPTLAEKTAN